MTFRDDLKAGRGDRTVADSAHPIHAERNRSNASARRLARSTRRSRAALQNQRNDIDIPRSRMDASVLPVKAVGDARNLTELKAQ